MSWRFRVGMIRHGDLWKDVLERLRFEQTKGLLGVFLSLRKRCLWIGLNRLQTLAVKPILHMVFRLSGTIELMCFAVISEIRQPSTKRSSNGSACFKMKGAEGLRVVDATVFPSLPRFFIVTPI